VPLEHAPLQTLAQAFSVPQLMTSPSALGGTQSGSSVYQTRAVALHVRW
jgi:hypothetical protein